MPPPEMSKQAADLVEYCQAGGRVCPQPGEWHAMWKLMVRRARHGGTEKPSLPLILGAWNYTSDLEKMCRLVEHIQWADAHGVLREVDTFLRRLSAEKWHLLSRKSIDTEG